jgi:acetoacetate decarboxylase
MFGNYKMHPNSGVNPQYAPAYPLEWECGLRTLEVMTKVDKRKVKKLLEDTPFELCNDRVAFRFMASPGHTLSIHNGRMFDLMVTVAVRYEGLFTQTHLFMYCSDPMGIAAGREIFGYTKKDCTYSFDEAPHGSIKAWSSVWSTVPSSPLERSTCAGSRIRKGRGSHMPTSFTDEHL